MGKVKNQFRDMIRNRLTSNEQTRNAKPYASNPNYKEISHNTSNDQSINITQNENLVSEGVNSFSKMQDEPLRQKAIGKNNKSRNSKPPSKT